MLSEISKSFLKLVVVDSVAAMFTIAHASSLRQGELARVHNTTVERHAIGHSTFDVLVTDLIAVDDTDGWVRLTFNDVSAILEHAHCLLPSVRINAQLCPIRLKAHTVYFALFLANSYLLVVFLQALLWMHSAEKLHDYAIIDRLHGLALVIHRAIEFESGFVLAAESCLHKIFFQCSIRHKFTTARILVLLRV